MVAASIASETVLDPPRSMKCPKCAGSSDHVQSSRAIVVNVPREQLVIACRQPATSNPNSAAELSSQCQKERAVLAAVINSKVSGALA
jgi:hypothetical protein